jgi:hypothetical protein
MTKNELAMVTLRVCQGHIKLWYDIEWHCELYGATADGNDPTEVILDAWAQHLRPKYHTILKAENGMVPWPDDWLDFNYNASNEACDMLVGPCSCGAWHTLEQDWVIAKLLEHNTEVANG